MLEKRSKKDAMKNRKVTPTVKHESSADSAQNINTSHSFQLVNNTRDKPASKRAHNGSDGSSNAGRGSNH